VADGSGVGTGVGVGVWVTVTVMVVAGVGVAVTVMVGSGAGIKVVVNFVVGGVEDVQLRPLITRIKSAAITKSNLFISIFPNLSGV
jgi:hypothetical protein